jgi:hypothetical protein
MLIDALIVLAAVLVIELVSSVKELVFQRRLVEILDRFLSRNIADYTANQMALGKSIVEQIKDWDVQLDEQSLAEAQELLQQGEPSVTP